jgi:ribonuclease D
MAVFLPIPVEMVTRTAQLESAVKTILGSPAIAVDTESNSYDYYPEQMCLIQIATDSKIYLVDSIILSEIPALKDVLGKASIMKVLHGADYDIRTLDRHYAFHIKNLYDTNIAAVFAGLHKVGLSALIKELLGITITKSPQLQRSHWGQRPLSAEAVDYAATDVRHLLAIQRILDQKLHQLSRREWVAEECARLEAVRYQEPNPDTAYLSVKGAQYLDGRGLAILRSLFMFREKEAQLQHRPLYYIIPDALLVSMANSPPANLFEVPGLRQIGHQRFRTGLEQALEEGLSAPLIKRSVVDQGESMTGKQLQRLRNLKEWRNSKGVALSLDPAVLWPRVSLERLAKNPDTITLEFTSAEVRRWQRDLLGAELNAFLKSLG